MSDTIRLRPGTLETFVTVLRAGSGLIIGPDKTYLLQSRLTPIVRRHGLGDLDALADRLRAPDARDLRQAVVEAMTTNESFFFRDDKPFAHLRAAALPRLNASRPATEKLRVWSAAASSGQEAYSIAMLASEIRGQLGGRTVEILGTDISREQLARARDGIYTQFEVQRGLPMQMLVKYFRKEGASWRIQDTIRAMAQFQEHNLLTDLRSLGIFDVVFCRNVLIYFDIPTKSKVLAAIAQRMAPDGLLYLGGAETVIGISDRFVPHGSERGVYELATATSRFAVAG